jgi:hypothetical protein
MLGESVAGGRPANLKETPPVLIACQSTGPARAGQVI